MGGQVVGGAGRLPASGTYEYNVRLYVSNTKGCRLPDSGFYRYNAWWYAYNSGLRRLPDSGLYEYGVCF
jgi:hypothetical protein